MPGCSLEPFVDRSVPDLPVSGFLHSPESPSGVGLVLTHGAGGDCQARLLILVAEAFCDAGAVVLRCDLPFRQMRPHGPPPRGAAERDQQGLRRAVECLRPRAANGVFLGGHSYGGRQASMLAAADPALVRGLLLLSYPLHPPKRPAELRTAHFPRLHTPALFVSGTRDGFATSEELSQAIKQIPARTRLVPISGAGHELLTKSNPDHLPGVIVEAFLKLFEALSTTH